jgi:cbb3-type cytochrome oxidase maturation protein
MIDYFFLVPIAIGMGLASLMWTLKNGQYEDLEGAAVRILFDADAGPILDGEFDRDGRIPGSSRD